MINKVSHIFLSLVLLVTTVGLTFNLHYCAGDLYSVAIDSKPKNCCKDDDHHDGLNNMNHEKICDALGKDINNCDDKTILVKISDDFTKEVQQKDTNNNFVVVLFNTIFQDKINCFAENAVKTNDYNFNNSPPTTGQFLSLHQAYLL